MTLTPLSSVTSPFGILHAHSVLFTVSTATHVRASAGRWDACVRHCYTRSLPASRALTLVKLQRWWRHPCWSSAAPREPTNYGCNQTLHFFIFSRVSLANYGLRCCLLARLFLHSPSYNPQPLSVACEGFQVTLSSPHASITAAATGSYCAGPAQLPQDFCGKAYLYWVLLHSILILLSVCRCHFMVLEVLDT